MTTIDFGAEGIPGDHQKKDEAESLVPFTTRFFPTSMRATGVMLRTLPVIPFGTLPALAIGTDPLERSFLDPADSAKVWTYWWWLEGAVTKLGITADLEAMKQQGIAGVIVFDSGFGGPDAPKGPPFMSRAWRENFKQPVAHVTRPKIALSGKF